MEQSEHSNEQPIINQIQNELALCYEHIGRKVPETIVIIAASLQEAIQFSSPEQVHEIFKRAKDIESIPTQKTLKECMRNYAEEWLKYRDADKSKSIEYNDPCAAWLPHEPVKKAINCNEAVKNYTIACGGNAYFDLCTARSNGPDYYRTYTLPIKKAIYRLYLKYWRKMPIANGYPASGPISLALIPATVDDFRKMFGYENAGHV